MGVVVAPKPLVATERVGTAVSGFCRYGPTRLVRTCRAPSASRPCRPRIRADESCGGLPSTPRRRAGHARARDLTERPDVRQARGAVAVSNSTARLDALEPIETGDQAAGLFEGASARGVSNGDFLGIDPERGIGNAGQRAAATVAPPSPWSLGRWRPYGPQDKASTLPAAIVEGAWSMRTMFHSRRITA